MAQVKHPGGHHSEVRILVTGLICYFVSILVKNLCREMRSVRLKIMCYKLEVTK